jgi:hypothetical protein
MRKVQLGSMVLLIAAIILSNAFGSDFRVSNVNLSSFEWGMQKADISLVRSDDDYHYIVATTDVDFSGKGTAPTRKIKKVFLAEPADPALPENDNTFIIKVDYEIPAAYGAGTLSIKLYDVIDTLDAILPSQLFYQLDTAFVVEEPEIMATMVDAGVQVPIFVEQAPAFDGHFNRILSLLLHRGETIESIAKMSEISEDVLKKRAEKLVKDGYFQVIQGNFHPLFHVIDKQNMNELKPVIDKTVDSLFMKLKGNLKRFDSTIAHLAATGKLTSDPHDLLDGGSVLYHKYPAIMVLLLWDMMGRQFVNDGKDFNIFEKAYKGPAYMGDFMYLVEGSPEDAGNTYYYYYLQEKDANIYCGIVDRPFIIPPGTVNLERLPKGVNYGHDSTAMYYSYNRDKIVEPLSSLKMGIEKYIIDMQGKVDSFFPPKKTNRLMRGARYWCWSVIVGRLMDKLENEGLVEKVKNGIYVFQQLD